MVKKKNKREQTEEEEELLKEIREKNKHRKSGLMKLIRSYKIKLK